MRLICLALGVGLMGCNAGGPAGPTLFPVTGVLTVGGQPVADVNVQLIPVELTENAVYSAGKTDASGKFSVVAGNGNPGAAKGKYKVVLSKVAAAAPGDNLSPEQVKKATEEYKKATGDKPPGQPGENTASLPFPKDYAKAETSPKEVDVVDKPVTLELSL